MNKKLLEETVIGRDFLAYELYSKEIPDTDVFLDWMNRLDELEKAKKYPSDWYKKEKQATKEILKIISERTQHRKA